MAELLELLTGVGPTLLYPHLLCQGPQARAAQRRHPAAVVMNVDDLESLEETLDIMDSAAVLSDIRESLAELAATEPPVLTREDAT